MRALGIVLLGALLGGCATLPQDVERPVSHAVADTGDTRLGRVLGPLLQAHPGRSGFYPLADGVEALLARLVLADMAQTTLDVQYYIWHNDQTGRALAQALLQAADRGVRVRVLLDDLGVDPDDQVLLALDAHPKIEVRLFNPVASRRLRAFSALSDFSRINRRMHNKAFIADNKAAILGGRNIGNEYFDAAGDVAFRDLDVLTIGAAVAEVSTAFDAYWNFELSYPVAALVAGRQGGLAELRSKLEAQIDLEQDNAYATRARDVLAQRLDDGQLDFSWGRAHLLYDAPQKALQPVGEGGEETRLLPQFGELGLRADKSLLIVSPYFVPGEAGVRWLGGQAQRGVEVVVLTNSLAATDVSAVHAGYQRYRRELLDDGVKLYELKADAQQRRKGDSGGSRASLHAKTFVFDRKAVFIGSMNLDPRSVQLNTEIGVLCESAALADHIRSGIEQDLPRMAYRVERSAAAGELVWIETGPAGELRHANEPGASAWRRFSVWFLGLLPIESQL